MNSSTRTLGFIALALGFLAMLVHNPKDARRLGADLREIARIIEREEDHVTVDELAEMLMQGSHHVRIIDIRDSALFATYHIPTAQRQDISSLLDISFPSSDSIVIYSDGGIHAAQAWMLLTLQGKQNVFTLRGGLNEWQDRIMSPVVSRGLPKAEHDRILKRAQFFGGEPKADNTQSTRKRPANPEPNKLKEPDKPREVC